MKGFLLVVFVHTTYNVKRTTQRTTYNVQRTTYNVQRSSSNVQLEYLFYLDGNPFLEEEEAGVEVEVEPRAPRCCAELEKKSKLTNLTQIGNVD